MQQRLFHTVKVSADYRFFYTLIACGKEQGLQAAARKSGAIKAFRIAVCHRKCIICETHQIVRPNSLYAESKRNQHMVEHLTGRGKQCTFAPQRCPVYVACIVLPNLWDIILFTHFFIQNLIHLTHLKM